MNTNGHENMRCITAMTVTNIYINLFNVMAMWEHTAMSCHQYLYQFIQCHGRREHQPTQLLWHTDHIDINYLFETIWWNLIKLLTKYNNMSSDYQTITFCMRIICTYFRLYIEIHKNIQYSSKHPVHYGTMLHTGNTFNTTRTPFQLHKNIVSKPRMFTFVKKNHNFF